MSLTKKHVVIYAQDSRFRSLEDIRVYSVEWQQRSFALQKLFEHMDADAAPPRKVSIPLDGNLSPLHLSLGVLMSRSERGVVKFPCLFTARHNPAYTSF